MGRSRDPLREPEALIRRVYAYVAYRVGDGPDAEDITSDVFERALRYRESYDETKGDPVSWLIGIARRAISEAYASRRPTATEALDGVAPVDIESESLRRLSVAAAVARLGERDRELIALRYGADLSARTIARVLDMKTNAVEVALHRARSQLRVEMERLDERGSRTSPRLPRGAEPSQAEAP